MRYSVFETRSKYDVRLQYHFVPHDMPENGVVKAVLGKAISYEGSEGQIKNIDMILHKNQIKVDH